MRSTALAALLALAALAIGPAAGLAQDAQPAGAALPKAPVPYSSLTPKRPAVARPHALLTPARAAAAPPVAGAPPLAASAPLTATGSRLSPTQPIPQAEVEAFVDGVVTEAMARQHIAGVTVSVVQGGQVLLKKGYGFSDLNPRRAVDPDRTLFRLGSISKTFTWITLMKEVDAGRIRLSQPINLYLPERDQVRDQGFDQPVRVVDLMSHAAGFEDRTLGHLMERDYSRVRPLDVYLRQERPKRVHAPGVVSSYSNYGAGLAGEAVSYVLGKPFERVAEEDIFFPLGMGRTTFREPHAATPGLPGPMTGILARDVAQGYRWTPSGFERRDYEYMGQIAPAGSASSTANDVARYMLMQLGGGQFGGVTVYGPATAGAFRTPLRATPKGINGWAHGFMVYDLPGGWRGYGHVGDTLSFHANMVVVPDLNLGIFIAANTETGRPLATDLPNRLVSRFYAAPRPFPGTPSADLAGHAVAFSGYFISTRRAYSGLEAFVDLLTSGVGVSVTPDGRLLTRTEDGTKAWVPEGATADGRFVALEGNERRVFRLADGTAQSFLTASGAERFDRAPLWLQPNILAVLASLTALASFATLGGLVVRNRREFRQNQVQSRASLVHNIQAVLWLIALVLFAVWVGKAGDSAQIMYRWPGALLVTASACALVSAIMTIATVIAMPAIWRGGRRVDSWAPLRRVFFTLTVLIYGAFSIVLAMWGALSPWSG